MSELYPVPDKSRTSWCFLVLETEEVDNIPQIVGWELAVANPHRILRIAESPTNNSSDEQRILSELYTQLQQYQHDNTVLHTVDDRSLSLLRTRLFVAETEKPYSLRGYYHIALQDVLDLFAPWQTVVLDTIDETGSSGACEIGHRLRDRSFSAESLWTIRRHVAPIVPVDGFQLNPL